MRYLPLALVLLLTLLVFVQVLGHDFVSWDDDVFLYQNPHYSPPTGDSLARVWAGAYAHLYAPVTYTAWWLVARVAGSGSGGPPHPGPFHCASLLAHLLTVSLAYALLLLLTRSRWPAAVGAMLFALHPLQVEPVAWASELKDLLSGAFGLAALLLYALSRRAAGAGLASGGAAAGRHATLPRSLPLYLLATLCFVLAMLSKPNAVALPLIACVLDYCLLRTPGETRRRALGGLLLRAGPWLLLGVAHAALTRAVQPPSEALLLPLWQRVFVAGDSLAFYLGRLAWPVRLGADYGRMPALVAASWWGYVTWLGPAALLCTAYLLRRRSRWALPALLWFALALLPVLGLLPFDFQQYSTVADHYAYLALFGPALALAGLAVHLRGFYPRLPVVVLLALLAAQSGLQTMTWRDSQVFWRHTMEVNPRSFLAHNNLGAIYQLGGALPRAAEQFELALQLKPDDPDTLVNLGMVLAQLRQAERAEGLLKHGLAVRPGDPKAVLMLGLLAEQAGRHAEAVPYLQQALAAGDSPLIRANLARALRALGRSAEAQALQQP